MKHIVKKYGPILVLVFAFGFLSLISENRAERALSVSWDYLIEMAFIIPPVFLLMGLIEVWVPKDKIKDWIGTQSGVKGMLISFMLGTLPTGPLYIAFPLAATMLKKGASVKNIVVFLGAWAALKIPQIMVEVEFLGLSFALLRFVLTATVLIIIAFIMDLYFQKQPMEFTQDTAKESNSTEG